MNAKIKQLKDVADFNQKLLIDHVLLLVSEEIENIEKKVKAAGRSYRWIDFFEGSIVNWVRVNLEPNDQRRFKMLLDSTADKFNEIEKENEKK